MFERYQRSGLSDAQQQKLSNASVLIAGAGGLGSGAISALSGLGVGKLYVLDSDVVELSNLNRQYIHRFCDIGLKKVVSAKRFAEAYNPDILVEALDMRLVEPVFDFKVDAIVDCFDNLESSLLLNELALTSLTPLVHGGIDGFCAQLTTVVPNRGPCLKCFLNKSPVSLSMKPTSLAPVLNLVSSMQSAEVLKLLLGLGDTLSGRLLRINLKDMSFKMSNISKNPSCCK